MRWRTRLSGESSFRLPPWLGKSLSTLSFQSVWMESPRIKALSLAKYCRYSLDITSCSSVFRLQWWKRRNRFEGTEAGEGNSLRVFNSIAHEWDVELNTRRKISYLQVIMYYFVHHISTIALYWQEKSNLLINGNKRIDNPPMKIVKCVSALKMKTCVESLKRQWA